MIADTSQLRRAFEQATISLKRLGYVQARAMRMLTLAVRANRFDTPRWKRPWFRYQLWCLQREVHREVRLRDLSSETTNEEAAA